MRQSRMLRGCLELLEDLHELLENAQILAGSIRIAELQRKPKVAGRHVRQSDTREKTPGVGVLASGCPIVSDRHDDLCEAILGHAVPIKGDAGIHYFFRRRRQFIEEDPRYHAEVTAPGSAASPKQIRIFILVDSAK